MNELEKKPKQKILIVDDSEINRAILREILCDEYILIEAVNGIEALELIKKNREDLVLVLLDLMMPELDGMGVLEKMNQDDIIGDIPVIMITAESAAEFIDKAYQLGVSDFVNRPLTRRSFAIA